MHRLRTRPAVALIALIAASVAFLAGARSAHAGTYRAVQCHAALGAGAADASFSRSSNRYEGKAACRDQGLTVTHNPGRKPTRSGRFGAWTLTAPPGTEIVRAGARVRAASQGWHVPQMSVGLAGGGRRQLPNVRGDLHGVSWTGQAGRSLIARLVCTHRAECGPGRGAHIHLRRISLALRDVASPSLELGGGLAQRGSRRGVQTLDAGAADAGSGVRTVTVDVNGRPLAARTLDCAISEGVALRLRPCPAQPSVRFDVPTTAQRFRQGPNRLRVCAADFARNTNVNRRCVTRTVRVDNECPVAAVGGARLNARFRGGSTEARVRAGRPAFVAGRVLGEDGEPLAGAEVCVAAKPRAAAARERVIATPRTDARGRFEARIPPGPSRQVRIAHWPGEERALERFLSLEVRARPSLRLSPRRTLRNGERLRFRVRLPGPAAGGRRVEVQARAGGRWVRVAGGRTGGKGVWTGSYRFRSTTGTRTYSFRARVPRQAGYPYAAGSSQTVRAKVTG